MTNTSRLGQIVHYKLSEHDVQQANQLVAPLNAAGWQNLNKPHPGDVCPAMILRDFGTSANLKVFLDGGQGAELWATSCPEGDGEGNWVPAP
ncbi:hypothetical protein [Streptomyces showdoensis]|uniref:Uncharacterized protein n=1 Tax=Streptomyces showdoensis TaxID=68268 RepID=A0A2P2GC06_STREW|nr:hypothetical protein [Streptomyces showdoensis]KKZ68948.1 hypothetical protein VO63_36895 [Streptomyces showdoensis]